MTLVVTDQPKNASAKSKRDGVRVQKRRLSELDWQLARHMVLVDGQTMGAVARELDVTPSSIRVRAHREHWRQSRPSTEVDTLEMTVNRRSQRAIANILRNLERAQLFENVMPPVGTCADGKPTTQHDAVKIVDVVKVGQSARAIQSLMRAARVASETQQILAKAPKSRQDQGNSDRAAIKAEFDRIAAKLPISDCPVCSHCRERAVDDRPNFLPSPPAASRG